MKFALANGQRQEAQPNFLGTCLGCGRPMIARCGEVRIWHWAHQGKRLCDPWWENETEWHRAWKGQFPDEWQEVVHYAENGTRHIADVKTAGGWVIEFQHSYLEPTERSSRNAFYPKLVWVVDGTRRRRDEKQFIEALNTGTQLHATFPIKRVRSDECALLREWVGSHAPIFFDFGNEQALSWLIAARPILRQNPDMPIPVPVQEIARLVGIDEISSFTETRGYEGMLVTNSEKTRGAIRYNGNNRKERQRFTIGHELGHMLIPHHKQSSYSCSKEDMIRYDKSSNARETQESEANRFSSALLMPKLNFKKRMKALGEPDLGHIEVLRKEYETSAEATARRYVSVSDYACAVVFANDKTVRYSLKSELLPYFLDTRSGHPLPQGSTSCERNEGIGEWQEIDSTLWLSETKGFEMPPTILEQTLWQGSGFKIILLYVEELPEEQEE